MAACKGNKVGCSRLYIDLLPQLLESFHTAACFVAAEGLLQLRKLPTQATPSVRQMDESLQSSVQGVGEGLRIFAYVAVFSNE